MTEEINFTNPTKLETEQKVNPIHTSVANNESGIALLLMAILLPSIIFMLSLTLNAGYLSIIRAELQSAGDAAALAGVQEFNSSQTGWVKSRELAIALLNQQIIHGSLGDIPGVSINADDTDTANVSGSDVTFDRTEWDLGNARISIKRGIWFGNKFISMEDSDVPSKNWQTSEDASAPDGMPKSNKGLPRFLLANAVQINIERPTVHVLVPAIGSQDSFSASRAAVAVAGPLGNTTIAPFALPVCSVVYQNGEQGEMMPGGAAESDICRGDRFFSKMSRQAPGEAVPEFTWEPEFYTDISLEPPPNNPQCDWMNRRFWDTQDHFGVVGLPEAPSPTEAAVRTAIENGGTNARIGDRFNILAAGLTEAESRDTVWEQISADPDSNHFPIDAGNVDVHGVVQRDLLLYLSGTCAPNAGICNSKRIQPYPSGPFCGSDFVSGAAPDTSVWHIDVPIIADINSTTQCGDGFGGTNDPELNSNADYRVVGFLKTYIYDVDVSDDPPASYSSCQTTGSVVGYHEQCNLVRGRVDCFTPFVTPATNTGSRTPILVDPA